MARLAVSLTLTAGALRAGAGARRATVSLLASWDARTHGLGGVGPLSGGLDVLRRAGPPSGAHVARGGAAAATGRGAGSAAADRGLATASAPAAGGGGGGGGPGGPAAHVLRAGGGPPVYVGGTPGSLSATAHLAAHLGAFGGNGLAGVYSGLAAARAAAAAPPPGGGAADGGAACAPGGEERRLGSRAGARPLEGGEAAGGWGGAPEHAAHAAHAAAAPPSVGSMSGVIANAHLQELMSQHASRLLLPRHMQDIADIFFRPPSAVPEHKKWGRPCGCVAVWLCGCVAVRREASPEPRIPSPSALYLCPLPLLRPATPTAKPRAVPLVPSLTTRSAHAQPSPGCCARGPAPRSAPLCCRRPPC